MSEKETINDQVTLSARLPERLVVSEQWPVAVTLRNASQERITISLRRDVRSDVTIDVRNAAGERLERTPFGKRHLAGQHIAGGFFDDVVSGILTHLEPGDSHSWEIELDKCFDFAPGEYIVEMSVSVQRLGRIGHECRINVLDAAR